MIFTELLPKILLSAMDLHSAFYEVSFHYTMKGTLINSCKYTLINFKISLDKNLYKLFKLLFLIPALEVVFILSVKDL